MIENLIIGAGPAGLATAGRFRKAGLDFTILEQSKFVGNSWRNHYDRLHLHTVGKWSHLPHFPFPEDFPKYVSRSQLVSYMDQYAATFDIQPVFNTEIKSISKETHHWNCVATDGSKYSAKNVVIASGINRIPRVPNWKGEDDFKGQIVHSRAYRNPKPFVGQSVLVIGIGNTGAEIALDLANHDITTYISVRSEITLVPRDLNGRPVQETAKTLEKFPFGIGDWLGSQIRKIYFGDLSKYGLRISKEHPVKLLREKGKTPLIDIGTIDAIKSGKIKVVGDINRFTANGVLLKSEDQIKVDSVILATGYTANLDQLIERGSELLDQFQAPKSSISDGYHQGLYFVGFDNYKTGGILGTIYTDSAKVCEAISKG